MTEYIPSADDALAEIRENATSFSTSMSKEGFEQALATLKAQWQYEERERTIRAIRIEHDEIDEKFLEYRAGLRRAARLRDGNTAGWASLQEQISAKRNRYSSDL